MASFIIAVGETEKVEKRIVAKDVVDASSLAMLAMYEFVATTKSPPNHVSVKVMDTLHRTLATIVFTLSI